MASSASSRIIDEQPPDVIARAIEDFLAEHTSAVLLEEGRMIFDMRSARYSIQQDRGRCTLHLWSDDRNMVRRIIGTALRKDTLRLASMRFGQTKPQTLELVSQPDRRTPTERDTTRRQYVTRLERVLQRTFADWKCDAFRSAMDLEKSFGPAYARGILTRGQDAWAVVGVNADESQPTIDGVLTVGLLWLQHCRDHAGGKRLFHGLRIVVPSGTALTTRSRMGWLRTDAAKWELYELSGATETLEEGDLADTGNLATRLIHAVNPQRATERFADSIATAMSLVPQDKRGLVELRSRSTTEMALLLHGLEFARIRHGAAANSFN
ncbi:MAG: hypothetical protein V4734_07560, partial [Terriglobus sp.]